MRNMALSILGLFLCIAYCAAALADEPAAVTVFAAASTTNALTDIGRLFGENQLGRFIPSFAASSTLAKQIEQGAPADIFISANPKWMDYLQQRGLLAPGTRFNLLGNRLVLIAPKEGKAGISIAPGFDLAGLLGTDKLAMGDPDHVPAGIYGKQALESLGIWQAVAPKVARCKDVRAALVLVERAEAPLGIVYATDAAISRKVKVIGTFPENSHAAITYPVAVLAGRETYTARAFLRFLKSPQATAIFNRYGFSVP